MAPASINIDNPVFRSYLFYSSVLVLKMMFMSIYTGLTRFKTGVSFLIQEPIFFIDLSYRYYSRVVKILEKHS